MAGQEKTNFEMKALRSLENGSWKFGFADILFHKSSVLLVFEAEFTESVLDILCYPMFAIEPTHLSWARRKIFKMKVLRLLENAILRLVFANTVLRVLFY